jgi:hypothetical protein
VGGDQDQPPPPQQPANRPQPCDPELSTERPAAVDDSAGGDGAPPAGAGVDRLELVEATLDRLAATEVGIERNKGRQIGPGLFPHVRRRLALEHTAHLHRLAADPRITTPAQLVRSLEDDQHGQQLAVAAANLGRNRAPVVDDPDEMQAEADRLYGPGPIAEVAVAAWADERQRHQLPTATRAALALVTPAREA